MSLVSFTDPQCREKSTVAICVRAVGVSKLTKLTRPTAPYLVGVPSGTTKCGANSPMTNGDAARTGSRSASTPPLQLCDPVLDPFASEGTVAKVALKMDRRAWLTEREPSYWSRLEAVVGPGVPSA